MNTLLLTRSEVEILLDTASAAQALRDGFIAYSKTRADRALRVRSNLPGPGTATVLFPGTLPDLPIYTVKVHSKFPDQKPAIRGVLCMHSVQTGELLAVMDSTYLTAVRTGIAGALAAHVLARPNADSVAVVGAGTQGKQQLLSLAALRPLRHVRVYDLNPSVGDRFCAEMNAALGVSAEPASTIRQAVQDAGIVLVATWSRVPLIHPGMLLPGAHLTTLGADEPGKAEVAEGVIRSSSFFCDDRALAAEMGALAGVGLTREFVTAELGEVLAGTHSGRSSSDQITVFGAVGLPFQDAVCAWSVYKAALEKRVGKTLDFLS